MSLQTVLQKTLSNLKIISLVGLCLSACEKSPSSLNIIAISQIIEHPSLNEERLALIDTLKKAGFEEGKNIHIVYENAQGNLGTAQQIAKKFESLEHLKVMVGISTPSSQTLVSFSNAKHVPMVFTSVTDPMGAKIIQSVDDHPNITGVVDFLSAQVHLAFIKKLMPSIKRLGIIYNPGESNSQILMKDLIEHAQKQNIELVLASANKTADVAGAAKSLLGRVDAIFIPNDNTAVASIETIISTAHPNGIPVFAGDVGSVERGAVATIGYNRTYLGRKAGDLIVAILNGKTPGELKIVQNHIPEVYIHKNHFSDMKLSTEAINQPIHEVKS